MRTFGSLEATIMEVMWSAERPLLVREVVDRLRPDRVLAHTTVQTVLEALRRKGWLQRTRAGRAYRYAASKTREDYASSLIEEVLSEAPDKTATLVRLFEHLNPDEARELSTALNTAKGDTA